MIDVETPNSRGWWLAKLHRDLYGRRVPRPTRHSYAPPAFPNESRADRLERLWSYFVGNPPLPKGAENARPLFEQAVRKARANYAELVVTAVLNRMRFLGVRTTADGDTDGDDRAREIATANELSIVTKDVHSWMFGMGDGYVIVGPPDNDSDLPVITAEDPRQTITAHDPARPAKVVAALKIYRNDDEGRDYAHVFTPGRVDVAVRDGGPSHSDRIAARSWSWDSDRSGEYTVPGAEALVPVTRMRNWHGMGEFESNTDLLDRINDTILRRAVIINLQAFRQRAVSGNLPDRDPQTGEVIDYDAVFSADPAAIWKLPIDSKLWESQQADFTPILMAIRDDVKELAASTSTPLHLITPDAAQGSAEGASLMREGLVYKVEDRRDRAEPRWLNVYRHAFLFAKDETRASGALSAMWAPAERFSLAEMGSAAAQAATSLPVEAIWTRIWQIPPADIPALHRQRADDLLMAQLAAPEPVPVTPVTPSPATGAQGA